MFKAHSATYVLKIYVFYFGQGARYGRSSKKSYMRIGRGALFPCLGSRKSYWSVIFGISIKKFDENNRKALYIRFKKISAQMRMGRKKASRP